MLSTVSNQMDDVTLLMQSIQKDVTQSLEDLERYDNEEDRLLENN